MIAPALRPGELALLVYLYTYTQRNGYAPTTIEMRAIEMRAALSLHPRTLYRRLRVLEAWGYVARAPRRERGVRVLRLPPVDAAAA